MPGCGASTAPLRGEGFSDPLLLMVCDKDTDTIGKDLAASSVQTTYPTLRKAAALPGARLVKFSDLGHAQQTQAPGRLHKALLDGLLPQ